MMGQNKPLEKTINDFLRWIETQTDASHAERFRDELARMPLDIPVKIMHKPVFLNLSDWWSWIYDQYEERIAMMAEGHAPTDAEILAARNDVFSK